MGWCKIIEIRGIIGEDSYRFWFVDMLVWAYLNKFAMFR